MTENRRKGGLYKKSLFVFLILFVVLFLVTLFSGEFLEEKEDVSFVKPISFVNVNVIPMDCGRVLENHTVIVKAGHIVAIGPSGTLDIPDGVDRVDGKGKYLLPGLAEMHAHSMDTDDYLLMVANGVTTVREMHGTPKSLQWRTQVARGKLVGPNIYTAGPIIEGEPPPELKIVIPVYGKKLIAAAADGAIEVARQKAMGFDFIKVYNNIPRDAYNGLVAAAKAHGLRVAGHVPFPVGLEGAFEAGQRTIEHLRGYIWKLVPKDSPEQPGLTLRDRAVSWQYADESRMADLAKATKKAGVFNCPTLMVARYWIVPKEDRDRYAARPFGVYMHPPPPPPKPGEKNAQAGGMPLARKISKPLPVAMPRERLWCDRCGMQEPKFLPGPTWGQPDLLFMPSCKILSMPDSPPMRLLKQLRVTQLMHSDSRICSGQCQSARGRI